MNNLVYFGGYSDWIDACVSLFPVLLGNLVYFLQLVIVSWAVENSLVYLWSILAGSMIMMASWAIENNLVYLRPILIESMIMIVSWSYPLVGL